MDENEEVVNQHNEDKKQKMNENAQKVKEKFFSFVDKSVEASKKGFVKASEAISDFGDKSVTRIEISKLKSKLEKLYAELGEYVITELEDSEKTLSSSTEKVQEISSQVKTIRSEISQKEELLSKSE